MSREKYFVIALVLISIIQSPQSAHAQDCSKKACIDVYVQDGKIIIEGRKGSGPTKAAPPKAAPPKSVVPKPAPPKPVVPKPVVPKPAPPKPAPPKAIPPKPAPPKPIATKRATTSQQGATSLSDRLSKSLPTGGISYQPNFAPLVNVPVYFWCDLPQIYRSEIKIIGETIDVLLRPSYIWSFGDGTFQSTTDAGAPYPEGKILHSYANPGSYLVTLITTWNGTYSHDATQRAITGTIKKTSIATIKIVAAPSRFMN